MSKKYRAVFNVMGKVLTKIITAKNLTDAEDWIEKTLKAKGLGLVQLLTVKELPA